ncbi:hypothetical protein CHS0354_013865 [Potamilus streckersoni]|uniref:Uncharacterized protein n=1 Tax=Potamilus streckersoni TaxID=2493646 RepID=A0AAE0T6G2_9BIVA|nr:hypothetical protein CHS0354_013865 [Potamilus streckersoni]
MYDGSINKNAVEGLSYVEGVCDFGDRIAVVEARYYHRTVQTATHELGHKQVNPWRPIYWISKCENVIRPPISSRWVLYGFWFLLFEVPSRP